MDKKKMECRVVETDFWHTAGVCGGSVMTVLGFEKHRTLGLVWKGLIFTEPGGFVQLLSLNK